MKIVSISLEQGDQYFGKIDSQRFFVGTRVRFDGLKGLMNIKGANSQKYDRAVYRPLHGFWADFIHPTAIAEGAFFHTLNTYDRARFTFSFLQFAAHVPNGDFIVYLKALLQLPLAKEYFPDLELKQGRIHRLTDNGSVQLENDESTEGIMRYFNPSSTDVEDTEVIQSAKMIHWVQNDPTHRDTQVRIGVEHFKRKMVGYANQYNLNGRRDIECLIVADIRHQGRANSPTILSALQSSNPVNALLAIGEPKFHGRLVTLRREINKLVSEGTLGNKTYNLVQRDFV